MATPFPTPQSREDPSDSDPPPPTQSARFPSCLIVSNNVFARGIRSHSPALHVERSTRALRGRRSISAPANRAPLRTTSFRRRRRPHPGGRLLERDVAPLRLRSSATARSRYETARRGVRRFAVRPRHRSLAGSVLPLGVTRPPAADRTFCRQKFPTPAQASSAGPPSGTAVPSSIANATASCAVSPNT